MHKATFYYYFFENRLKMIATVDKATTKHLPKMYSVALHSNISSQEYLVFPQFTFFFLGLFPEGA